MRRIISLLFFVSVLTLVMACGVQEDSPPLQAAPSSGQQSAQPQSGQSSSGSSVQPGAGAQQPVVVQQQPTPTIKSAPADLGAGGLAPGNIEYLAERTILETLDKRGIPIPTNVAPFVLGDELIIQGITWGGEEAFILCQGNSVATQPDSMCADFGFGSKYPTLRLLKEDDQANQIKNVYDRVTPFYRATVGMQECVREAFETADIRMVPILQMTWSVKGDKLVSRKGINQFSDLRGKNIVAQQCGPHLELIAKAMNEGGVGYDEVNLRLMRDLTLAEYPSGGIGTAPIQAMERDRSIDVGGMIAPDASAAVSGVVPDSKILFGTDEGKRIIADVWWVEEEFFNTNRELVETFVRAYLTASEEINQLKEANLNRQTKSPEYIALMKASGRILLGGEEAADGAEELLDGAEFVGLSGNIQFFECVGTNRCLATLHQENQDAMLGFGFRTKELDLPLPGWDFAAVAAGTSLQAVVNPPTPQFNARESAQFGENRRKSGKTDDAVRIISVPFKANSDDLDAPNVDEILGTMVGWVDTYPGARMLITAYTDVLWYNEKQLEYANAPNRAQLLADVRGDAERVARSRAATTRTEVLRRAEELGIYVTEEMIAIDGAGVADPVNPNPIRNADGTCTGCEVNRRATFELIPIDSRAGF